MSERPVGSTHSRHASGDARNRTKYGGERRQRRKVQIMMSRLTAVVLLAGGLALGCADGVAPPSEVHAPAVLPSQRSVIPAAEFKPLGWSAADPAPLFSGFATTADGTVLPPPRDLPGPEVLASPSAGTLPLAAFQVSFWAVKGQQRSAQINYLSSACATSSPCPYFRFTVPKQALERRPDGGNIWWGDSVLITASVDSSLILVRMEPTGLEFDHDSPPLLEIWYTGASDDLNGDGAVDATDTYIKGNLLGLFSQQQLIDPWLILSSSHDVATERFQATLGHFTGFAVSY